MNLSTSRDLVRYQEARAASLSAVEGLIAQLPEGDEREALANAVHVLAFLSAQAARALRRGELSEAAALMAIERSFLEKHGGSVLSAGAERLRREKSKTALALAERFEEISRESVDPGR